MLTAEKKVRIDRDSRRQAILDVAEQVFLSEGFATASMSMIAARLGGSKGTLYNYFKSKHELFEAYVSRHCAWHQEATYNGLDAGDIHATLNSVGCAVLGFTLSDFAVNNFRLIISETPRAPGMGQAFYEAGPLAGARMLAEIIEEAVRRRALRPVDALMAAHQFLSLCQNRWLKSRLLDVDPEPTRAEIKAEVAAAVEIFMAAFGPVAPPAA